MRKSNRRRKSSNAVSQEEQFESRAPQSQSRKPESSIETATEQLEEQPRVAKNSGRNKSATTQTAQFHATIVDANVERESDSNATETGGVPAKKTRISGRRKSSAPQREGNAAVSEANTQGDEAAPAKETVQYGRWKNMTIAQQEDASIAALQRGKIIQLEEAGPIRETRDSGRRKRIVPQETLAFTPAGNAQVDETSLRNAPQPATTAPHADMRRTGRKGRLAIHKEQSEPKIQGGASAQKPERGGDQRETLSAEEVVEEQHVERSGVSIQTPKQASKETSDVQAQEAPSSAEDELREQVVDTTSQKIAQFQEKPADEPQISQRNIQPTMRKYTKRNKSSVDEKCQARNPNQSSPKFRQPLELIPDADQESEEARINASKVVVSTEFQASSSLPEVIGGAATQQVSQSVDSIGSDPQQMQNTPKERTYSKLGSGNTSGSQGLNMTTQVAQSIERSENDGYRLQAYEYHYGHPHQQVYQPSKPEYEETRIPHASSPSNATRIIQPRPSTGGEQSQEQFDKSPSRRSPGSQDKVPSPVERSFSKQTSPLRSSGIPALSTSSTVRARLPTLMGLVKAHQSVSSRTESPALIVSPTLLQSESTAPNQALQVQQLASSIQYPSPFIFQQGTSPKQPIPNGRVVSQQPLSESLPRPHSDFNHQQTSHNARGSRVNWNPGFVHNRLSEPPLQSIEVDVDNTNQGPAGDSRGGIKGRERGRGGARGHRKTPSDTRALRHTRSPLHNKILGTNVTVTYDAQTSRGISRGRGRGRGRARGRGKLLSEKRATLSVHTSASPAPDATPDLNGKVILKAKSRAPRGSRRGRPRGSGRGGSAGLTRNPSTGVSADLEALASSGQGSLAASGGQVHVRGQGIVTIDRDWPQNQSVNLNPAMQYSAPNISSDYSILRQSNLLPSGTRVLDHHNANLYGGWPPKTMAALNPTSSYPTQRVLLPRPTLEQARQQFENETTWAREISRESSEGGDSNPDGDSEGNEEGESELGSEDQSEEEYEEDRIDDGFISDADSVEDEIQAGEEKIAKELARFRGEAHIGRKRARQKHSDGKHRNVHRGPRKAKELTGDLKMRIGKATKLFLEQDYQGAMKLVDETIGLNAETFEAWTLKASLYKEQGDIDSAIESLYIGAHFRHREVDPWFYCAAYCLEETGNLRPLYLKKAKMCFAKALVSQGDNLFALFSRADLYMETLGFKPALNTYARILNRHRKHDLRALRGILESAINLRNGSSKALKDGTTAIAMIEAEIKTLREDPDEFEFNETVYKGTDDGTTDPNALFGWDFVVLYAELIMASNQYHNALKNTKSLARLLVGREEEIFWDEVSKNDCEWDTDDTRRSTIPEFEAGHHPIETYSTELPVEIRVKLGVCRLCLQEEEEAMRHFKWVDSSQVEEKPHLWWEIADALFQAQKFVTALKFYEPLLSVPEECTALLYIQLGTCYLEKKLDAEAEKYFQQAADLDESNTEARGHLAKLFEKRGEKTLALDMSNLVKQLMLEQAIPKTKKQGRKPWDGDDLPFVRKLVPLAPRPSTRFPFLKPTTSFTMPRPSAGLTISKPRPMLAPLENSKSEEQISKHLELQYYVLCKERNRMRAGNLYSITAYLEAAKALTEDFRRVRAFYPADKSLKFAGYNASESKQASMPLAQDMRDMVTRLSQQLGANFQERSNRLPPGIPDMYRGMPFATWLDIFMEYAICLAKKRELRKCYEICQSAKDCIVFHHSRDDMFVLHLCWSMCALMLNDLDMVINLANFFLTEYQFTTDTYRLFAVLARACRGNISWYNAGPTQQFLLKQIRLMDYSLTPESEKASFPASNRAKYSAVDKDGKIIIPTHLDLSLLMLYGYMLSLGKNYTETLHYFMRAWTVDPDNAMINLSIGLTHMHLALSSQSENRQQSILQALTFVFRYYDTRKESQHLEERLEAHYNVARTYHTLSLFHLAIPYYWKVLNEETKTVKNDIVVNSAYNLQALYTQNGNLELAKSVAMEFLVI